MSDLLHSGKGNVCRHDLAQQRLPLAHIAAENEDLRSGSASSVEQGYVVYAKVLRAHHNSEPLTFLDLPNEILSHIVTYLDSPPPSKLNKLEKPEKTLTDASQHPLKDASLTSKRLRSLTSKLLFKHARLDPYNLSNFLAFVEKSKLNDAIQSLTAILQGPCNHIHPAWWARLLNDVPLTDLTIHAAPHVFSEIAPTTVDDSHAWAFNMPYHTLTLVQTVDAAHQHISYNHLPSLLIARPWHTLRFNEGSSILAYSTYEYFLKRTPSLLASLHLNRCAEGAQLFANLECFEFIAIFPFFNHVDEILKCVRQMLRLKTLFVKLCPEPESTVLSDEIEAVHGHFDVNDPWNEFDTAYHLIAHSVRFLVLEGALELFIVDDVKMTGIRESLKVSLDLRLSDLSSFRKDGHGIWRRQSSQPVS